MKGDYNISGMWYYHTLEVDINIYKVDVTDPKYSSGYSTQWQGPRGAMIHATQWQGPRGAMIHPT